MIFISLGTQKFQFNRLLKYIDEKIKSQEISEEVFAQIGYSTYIPQNYEYKDFLDKKEFESIIEKSDLLITHAGVGTIIAAMKHEKPIIVVPRLSKFEEHVDNHQLQIAEAFSSKNIIISNGEKIEDLLDNINKAKKFKFEKYISSNKKIQSIIEDFITSSFNTGE